jgi:3',5'-cyclic AMP phosphodiesterase CpdA
MRLAWLTDIHLDFIDAPARAALAATVRAARPDGVIVTGDIAIAPTVHALITELGAAIGAPLWFVLGNHDFYRGSVDEVRARALAANQQGGAATWLQAAGVIRLAGASVPTALVGVDGWGDGRLGDFARTRVELNDFYLIDELARVPREVLRTRLAAYGDEAAATLAPLLAEALSWAEHVVVATHVPPFREACWHEGAISDDNWLPFFTCAATGEVIRAALAAHPAARATVLCGHTHSDGEAAILPNLRVLTGAADYGRPRPQRTLEL